MKRVDVVATVDPRLAYRREAMSRRRKRQPRRAARPADPYIERRPKRRRPPSAEAIIAGIFAGFIGYVAVEIALPGKPHPTHWIVTVVLVLLTFGGVEAFDRGRNPY